MDAIIGFHLLAEERDVVICRNCRVKSVDTLPRVASCVCILPPVLGAEVLASDHTDTSNAIINCIVTATTGDITCNGMTVREEPLSQHRTYLRQFEFRAGRKGVRTPLERHRRLCKLLHPAV